MAGRAMMRRAGGCDHLDKTLHNDGRRRFADQATRFKRSASRKRLSPRTGRGIDSAMTDSRAGQIAVIFATLRTEGDDAAYQEAAAAMAALAAEQPGYCGMASARTPGALGITVSYWDSRTSAARWRDHPDHAAMREAGRNRWYRWYSLDIATIDHSYEWTRDD